MIKFLISFFKRFLPTGNLIDQAIAGGIWVSALNITNRLLQLGKLVIVARLLSPSAFGIFGIAMLAMSGFRALSDLGIDEALIQRNTDNVEDSLNTAWIFNIVRGVLITGLVFLLAPVVADLFAEPRATNIIRIIGIIPLISGFKNPGIVYLDKELEFHRKFVFSTSATAISFVITVVLAFIYQNVWALAIGSVSGNITKLISSYFLYGFRPQLKFDRDIALDLIDFGKHIFGSSTLKFLVNEGDDAFVGWYLSATTLGLYQMAYRISNLVATEIGDVITEVTFPMYSKIQQDQDTLNKRFTQASQVSTIVVYPLTGGLIALAPEIVRVILGNQWLAMVPAMQVLAILGALKSIGYAAIFKGIGRPDFILKNTIVRFSLILLTIFPLTDAYGMTGTAVSVVSATLFIEFMSWYFLAKIGYPLRDLFHILLVPILATIMMTIFVLLGKNIAILPDIFEIIIFVPVGACIYIGLIYAEDRLIGSYRGWLLVDRIFWKLIE